MYRHGGDIYLQKNCIDFSANINFRGMPDSVRRAAEDAVKASEYYPDPRCTGLREAIAGMEGVLPSAIFCGNGAADVIISLVNAVKPRRALLPVPSFYEYRRSLDAVGCEVVPFLLREENGFRLTEDVLELITPDIRMIFLCSPNNPTGLLPGRELSERILRRCEVTKTLLVLDECFMDLTADPERDSMLHRTADSDSLFVLKAFTKSFAMPGLRLGYGVCRDSSLLRGMEAVSQPWRVSVPAQAAGIAAARLTQPDRHLSDAQRRSALPDGAAQSGAAFPAPIVEQDYLAASREAIRMNRERMIAELRRMGYRVWDSAANFVFFRGDPGLAEKLRKRGILIRDCSNFEGLGDGYYRTAVRSERENEVLLHALQSCTDSGKER